ncbi:DUF5343 domain-containing protein [Candidatus Parcubacteria bacterium]|nr:DUF5343 domain-containing protein [Candidatus Parcubacteria bacterium]
MALNCSYLITTKNLESFLNSIITAKAPDTFTQKFIESLEFKSTNDRLYIGLLKGLGFLDANAVPTERYFKFLDQSQSKQVLAEAVKEAYGDLFAVNTKANELTQSEVKNKFKTLTQGKISEKVLHLMANTFKALVDYAEWGTTTVKKDTKKEKIDEHKAESVVAPTQEEIEEEPINGMENGKLQKTELHYNIQIHLPESRDPAVYDALFKSLKKHLF